MNKFVLGISFPFILTFVFFINTASAELVTKKIYSELGKDGRVYQSTFNWDVLRNSVSGFVDKNEIRPLVGKNSYGMYSISRDFISFDTSIIPLEANIVEAKIVIFNYTLEHAVDDDYDWFTVLKPTVEYSGNVTAGDFDKCGSLDNPEEGIDIVDRVELSSLASEGVVNFKLNNTGLNWINKDGISEYCFRIGHDVMNIVYPGSVLSANAITAYTSTSGIEGKKPYLEITYTIPDKNEPVVLVPGVMGSWEKGGELLVDPILHTYDGLLTALDAAGYEAGDNLEVFTYDWQKSNVETAALLAQRIGELKARTGAEKVDVVAHSMGGLVARQYAASDAFGDDIDDLIFLNTPHSGSPESYLAYFYGYMPGVSGGVINYFVKAKTAHAGSDNFLDYLQSEFSSVQELLPVYDYLFINKGNNSYNLIPYPLGFERNEFLENLNEADVVSRLASGTALFNITSYKDSVEDETIISLIRKKALPAKTAVRKKMALHECYLPYTNDIVYGPGDGTVPVKSLRGLSGGEDSVFLDVSHRDIVTASQQEVVERLTGTRPATVEKYDWWPIKRMILAAVFSPIDITIVGPDGKRQGKDQATLGEYSEIPGGFYSGFAAEEEFVTIPNPLDGEYKILVHGVADGFYKILFNVLDDESVGGEDNYIVGFISTGEEKEIIVQLKDGKAVRTLGINDLLADLAALEAHSEITQKNLYKIMKISFEGLARRYADLERGGNCLFGQALERWIELRLKMESKQLDNYYEKGWISEAAHDTLEFDIDSLLGGLSV